MKIMLKEKLMELAASMESANRYFRGLSDKETAGDLFVLCQTAAEQMGDIIEGSEGESAPAISLLEEYCELIYRLYSADLSVWGELLDNLEAQTAQVQGSIERDIPVERMKAVFLPYSASMWDCFDSVYAEAVKDARFDVKVIPIPYYSLNPNGEPLEAHYEGQEVEKYAEITDYKTYDFAQERPDVVFIHNPYDGCNLVTRVFEQFYSSELVKYTPHLVYIPYYVSKDRTMAHYALLPGVQNAWRIFVQDETVRQQYIDGGIDPERVVASGSPKMDMIARLSQGEKPIPPEWSVLKGKRVFFYNTAVTDILNHRECFLEKVQYVIDTCKKHPDTALLWRPHPLSVSTMQSMAPELLNGYLKMVDEFKRSGLGVYDETGELDRAIAISDGYIGDASSSVSQLYEATGKPVLNIEYYDPNLHLDQRWARARCGEMIKGKLYMFSWEYNKIIVYDEAENTVTLESGNNTAAEYEKFLYLRSAAVDDLVYFTSGASPTVLKYNASNGKKTLIELGDGNVRGDCVLHQGKLYLLPTYYSKCMKVLDLKTEKVQSIATHYEEQFPMLEGNEALPLFIGDCLVKNKIWRACQLGTFLQVFDVIHNQLEYIKVNGLKEALLTLVFDGKYFWCAALKGNKLYKWDFVKNRIVQTIEIECTQQASNRKYFSQMCFYEGGIWVFFREEYRVARVDASTGRVEYLSFSDLFQNVPYQCEKPPFSEVVRTAEGMIYLLPYYADGVVKINARTREISLEQIPIVGLLENAAGNRVSESMCSLGKFLGWHQLEGPTEKKNVSLASGEKIWSCILRDCL